MSQRSARGHVFQFYGYGLCFKSSYYYRQSPVTLFRNFSELMDTSLKEVFIHKLEEGVFYSQLVFLKDGKEILMDSRTSDAVALALRFGCPIYIKDTEYDDVETAGPKQDQPEKKSPPGLSELSISELKVKLDEAIKAEDYEKAAFIKDEIDRREEKKI